jgi:predicted nucleic acid-binding protein
VIVVDTSVWIDVLNGVDSVAARTCTQLIEDGDAVAGTDVIFTEILQGLRDDREAAEVGRHLRAFPMLRLESLDPRRRALPDRPRQRRHHPQDTRLPDRRTMCTNKRAIAACG